MSHNVNVNHTVNGVAVPWAGQSVVGAPGPTLPITRPALGGEVDAAIERLGTSRVAGLASMMGGATLATASTVAVFALGAPVFVLSALVPAALLLTVGGVLSLRRTAAAPSAVMEGQILESAQRRGGTITVALLALDTHRSMAECQQTLDAMVAGGWATVDFDDNGLLSYHIAALGPAAPR